jgi:Type II secretion system protein B
LSSILDALNKLEKEGAPQDYPLANTRAGRKVFIAKSTILMIGVVCLCIGTIGFVIYNQRGSEKVSEPVVEEVQPVVTSKAQETVKPLPAVDDETSVLAPAQKTPTPLPTPSQDPKSMVGISNPETVISDDTPIIQPKSPEAESAGAEIKTESGPVMESKPDMESENEIIEKPAADKAIPETGSPVITREKDTPDSNAGSMQEMADQEEKPEPLDRLEGVGLKIQAISWGETPQERLAVINNQVLREGDGIEGYQISHINPDDIVLRRGGKSYQLDFSLKGGP